MKHEEENMQISTVAELEQWLILALHPLAKTCWFLQLDEWLLNWYLPKEDQDFSPAKWILNSKFSTYIMDLYINVCLNNFTGSKNHQN